LREACFWAENGGGGLKNVKKLKKKRQKVHKSLKKEGKRRKIEKKATKRCQKSIGFFNSCVGVKMGKILWGKISLSK
jgi:hypothetical protein